MSLPFDYARCMGRESDDPDAQTCPHRTECERYTDWHAGYMGPWTPVFMRMCRVKEHRIVIQGKTE